MDIKSEFLGIKNFRKRVKMTQKQLAEILNVGSIAYNHYELGRSDASFSIYKKLFEMGATVEELFGVPYSAKPPRAELKVSREEAIEIVRAGMSGLIGSAGVVSNSNVMERKG